MPLTFIRAFPLLAAVLARLVPALFVPSLFVPALFVPTLVTPALAADERGTLSLVVENDMFGGADRWYSNGLRINWLSAPFRTEERPGEDAPMGAGPARWLARQSAWLIPGLDQSTDLRLGWSLGQNMYTPSDITRRDRQDRDRPYAGWTYVSLSALGDQGNVLDTLEATLGVVGPASGADRTQDRWHQIIGVGRPQGWDHQLKNEPGLNLLFERKWRVPAKAALPLGLEADIMPHATASLGNVATYGAGGFTVRIGDDLKDDYGPPRIRPALAGSGFFKPQDTIGWYVFAGIEGRAVARDIFLDGNSFVDSPSVTKYPFVGDAQVGLALVAGPVRLSYTHVFRTREFVSQGSPAQFGALSLSIRF